MDAAGLKGYNDRTQETMERDSAILTLTVLHKAGIHFGQTR